VNRATLLFVAALSACRPPSPTGGIPPFQERILASIPEGAELVPPIAFSQDGREAAYIVKSPEGYRAVRGPWKSRRLDAL
jgi:hypothetical protein